jgi:hypothetical protein
MLKKTQKIAIVGAWHEIVQGREPNPHYVPVRHADPHYVPVRHAGTARGEGRRDKEHGELDVRVLAIEPHPDQATNNPCTWAAKLCVSRGGKSRTFWRWHYARTSKKKPTVDEVVAWFWDTTFAELHGFDFEEEVP